MNDLNNYVNNKLLYSVKYNNRDVVSAICSNELQFLLTKVEFVQDRQMLESMICGINRQIDKDIPLKLVKVCNIINCKDCNYSGPVAQINVQYYY